MAVDLVTRRARTALAGAGLLMALSGCGGGDAAEAAAAGGGPGGRGAAGGPTTVPVEITQVIQGSIARAVTVSGAVEPIRTVGVTSQLSGVLLTVEAEEGDLVRRGATLGRIDVRELEAQMEAASAAFEVAEAAFQRAEQLRDRRVITVAEYERERTAYVAARAQMDQLRTRLAYATVDAPITGVVTEKRVEAGDLVAPQTRLFTVADVSTLVVRVGVSELDVVDLSEGDLVTVRLDAFPGRSVPGRIRRIFPQADPGTRLLPVEVALENTDPAVVRPGFMARVAFALGARDDVLLIPASALVGGSGSEAVFVVEDGHAVRRTVQTGVTSEGNVEVVAGLQAGERVIIRGNTSLRDGMAVRVVESGAGTAG
ncbi:MAG TPA: efflux RND transporter periplasmic adaptor subunit [Longimicrobiales bacterium]|nr:efflux RND transporter periplasmic adaptor subunit [Longimicrobiales bacterium]